MRAATIGQPQRGAHTDRTGHALRLYHVGTPTGAHRASQTASAATDGMCCGSMLCMRVHIPTAGTHSLTASLSTCYRHRTPSSERQTASASTDGTHPPSDRLQRAGQIHTGTRCGSMLCMRVHIPTGTPTQGAQSLTDSLSTCYRHNIPHPPSDSLSGYHRTGLRLYHVRAATIGQPQRAAQIHTGTGCGSTMVHTHHRTQERHTDSLSTCYRHNIPSSERQTASAATIGQGKRKATKSGFCYCFCCYFVTFYILAPIKYAIYQRFRANLCENS
jgi:hypothetical protein